MHSDMEALKQAVSSASAGKVKAAIKAAKFVPRWVREGGTRQWRGGRKCGGVVVMYMYSTGSKHRPLLAAGQQHSRH